MFRPAIKQIVRCAIPRFVVEPVRYSSAAAQAQPLVNLTVDEKSGIATLTLNRSPVNSLNLHLLSEISCSLDQLEANKSRGLIITSVRIQQKPNFKKRRVIIFRYLFTILCSPPSQFFQPVSILGKCTNRIQREHRSSTLLFRMCGLSCMAPRSQRQLQLTYISSTNK